MLCWCNCMFDIIFISVWYMFRWCNCMFDIIFISVGYYRVRIYVFGVCSLFIIFVNVFDINLLYGTYSLPSLPYISDNIWSETTCGIFVWSQYIFAIMKSLNWCSTCRLSSLSNLTILSKCIMPSLDQPPNILLVLFMVYTDWCLTFS